MVRNYNEKYSEHIRNADDDNVQDTKNTNNSNKENSPSPSPLVFFGAAQLVTFLEGNNKMGGYYKKRNMTWSQLFFDPRNMGPLCWSFGIWFAYIFARNAAVKASKNIVNSNNNSSSSSVLVNLLLKVFGWLL